MLSNALESAGQPREAIKYATQGITIALNSGKRDKTTLSTISLLYGRRASQYKDIFDCSQMRKDMKKMCEYDSDYSDADCKSQIISMDCENFVKLQKEELRRNGLPMP